MFNVYLPKLLETRSSEGGTKQTSLEGALWDVVIFTIGGCPGAVVSQTGLYSSPPNLTRALLLARRLAYRVAARSTALARRQHVCHRDLLCRLRDGGERVRDNREHGWN
jgi:hypothetical protein